MSDTGKLAAAALGGYILGRRKKFKLALGLGLYLGAKKLDVDPRMLVKSMAKELGSLPAVGELKDQTRDEVVSVGKDAAGKLVGKWAESLADSLNDRTERLRSGAGEAAQSAAGTATGAAATATGAASGTTGEARRSRDADGDEAEAKDEEAVEKESAGESEETSGGRAGRTRSSGAKSATGRTRGAAGGTRQAAARGQASSRRRTTDTTKSSTTRKRSGSKRDGDERG